jgi:hypothetical protein
MVIIRADKDVDYENVENLIETIKTKTRAKKIAVATKQKNVVPGEEVMLAVNDHIFGSFREMLCVAVAVAIHVPLYFWQARPDTGLMADPYC